MNTDICISRLGQSSKERGSQLEILILNWDILDGARMFPGHQHSEFQLKQAEVL